MSEKLGKIGHLFFDDFMRVRCGHPRPELQTGPGFGVDVSVVELPQGMAMAMTSDPLSLIPSLGLRESAWLSVHLMVNDMATTGFAPMYGQFVLNLPSTFLREDFIVYWDYIHQFCNDAGIAITGGHTGFIEGQNSTIAGGGTLITVAPLDKIRVSSFTQPGDHILVTKSCAISSSAILAMSFPETVKNKAGKEVYEAAAESFYSTSSLQDGLIAMEAEGVSAMHDVTEGGVLGAIYEMAVASGNGAIIQNEKLPVGRVQSAVCKAFNLDARYCIGAGSMIITCKENAVENVISRLAEKNIPCVDVGEMTASDDGILLEENGVKNELIYREEDPYWIAFFKALKEGLK